MSKRSFRRLAIVATAAMAAGAMAPSAMAAISVDAGAGTEASVDVSAILGTVTGSALPLPLPELDPLSLVGTATTLVGGVNSLVINDVTAVLGGAEGIVAAVNIPAVNVTGNSINVLGAGILNNNGDLNLGDLNVAGPVLSNVLNVGGLGGSGLPLDLGSLLDASLSGDVNILASVMGAL